MGAEAATLEWWTAGSPHGQAKAADSEVGSVRHREVLAVSGIFTSVQSLSRVRLFATP